MAIAIVSDIHGNLEALESVLEDIDKNTKAHGITETHCLGDTVGYGPNPIECVQMARERFSSILMGNHEEAACYLDNSIIDLICKKHAAIPVKWIREAIFRADPEMFEYLRNRPYVNLPEKDELQREIAEVHGTLCLDAEDSDIEFHKHIHPRKQPHDAITCASINRYSTSEPLKVWTISREVLTLWQG